MLGMQLCSTFNMDNFFCYLIKFVVCMVHDPSKQQASTLTYENVGLADVFVLEHISVCKLEALAIGDRLSCLH